MNQLNKLIQQYETENPGEKAVYTDNPPRGGLPIDYYEEDFVLWLASRPTCGQEQRKFLDEVEKQKLWFDGGENFVGIEIPNYSTLYQSDFDSDLQKVIKGE